MSKCKNFDNQLTISHMSHIWNSYENHTLSLKPNPNHHNQDKKPDPKPFLLLSSPKYTRENISYSYLFVPIS